VHYIPNTVKLIAKLNFNKENERNPIEIKRASLKKCAWSILNEIRTHAIEFVDNNLSYIDT